MQPCKRLAVLAASLMQPARDLQYSPQILKVKGEREIENDDVSGNDSGRKKLTSHFYSFVCNTMI